MLRDALGRLGARLLAHGAARQGKRRLAEAVAVAADAPGGRAYLSSARLYSAHPAQLLEEELLPDTSGCVVFCMPTPVLFSQHASACSSCCLRV